MIFLKTVLFLACIVWIFIYAGAARAMRHARRFEKLSAPEPSQWPKASIVVAARDEAEGISKALPTLLELDYPSLEVIFVNDRSTDNTGPLADELAARNSRLNVIHIDTLPDGWLGKVHALSKGAAIAQGDWILFTDADVHMKPEVLRQAIALAENEGLDHLALLPRVWGAPFMLEVVLNTFAVMFLLGTGAHREHKKGMDRNVGIGAFNLVRRSTLDKSPGFEWLRMEVTDDLGLSLLISKAGGKSGFAIAYEHIGLKWYGSVAGIFRGLEKNFFGSLGRYSYLRAGILIAAMGVFSIAPVAGPFLGMPNLIAAVTAMTAVLNAAFISRRAFGSGILSFLMAPAGYLLLGGMLLWSALRCFMNHGITWRGNRYDIEALRKGQRVRL